MAEDFLEAIYKEAGLLCELRQTVEYTRVHDDLHTIEKCNKILPQLCELCKRYVEQDAEKGMKLWTQVQNLNSVTNDLIFLGDILEYHILPLVEESMRQWGEIRTENEEGDYLFESTISGFLTIKDLQEDFYIHSTVDPMWEARQTAEGIYNPATGKYSIRGCGLGYLIYQLYDISNESAVIRVFEKDARMVEYARKYGVLDWVPKENLEIIVDENPAPFLESGLEEGVTIHMFAPQLLRESPDVKSALEELNIQYCSELKHRRDISINYWNNLRSGCPMVDEFDFSGLSKEVIIAAGGPSLDDNMEFIQKNCERMTLISVGTVFRKLLAAGMEPDIVTILESDPKVYEHIKGLEDQRVPLIMALTAYWKIASAYQGDKYLVSFGEEGFSYGTHGESWLSAATVTSLAMDIAIRLGAEKIYLAGADLAYPGGMSHAKGTTNRVEKSLEGMIPIEGVGGTTVYTDQAFYLYKEEIEERIAATPQITYYNLSRIGARIAGTVEYHEESMGN